MHLDRGSALRRPAVEHPPELPADGPSDADLIQRTLAGEKECFAGIVARYQDRAYWAAMNLLGDPEESRDVAQEAFLRAYKALARFDFGMSFYTWLYRIVVNLAIDHLRKRKRARAVSLDDFEPVLSGDLEEDQPARGMELADSAARVRTILDRLPEKYRTVMVLRDLDELSCKEIASIVRSTHSTVRWRLHIARKMFRKHWEKLDRVPAERLAAERLAARRRGGAS